MEDESPLPGHLRLAVLRLARRLRQQTVGDLTSAQLSALSSVAKNGEMSLGRLAEIEQVAPPSMTRVAAKLEELGLVTRRVDDDDRRVARVVVNQAGEDMLTRTRSLRDAYLAARLARLSSGERETLAAAVPVLERLAGLDDPRRAEPVESAPAP